MEELIQNFYKSFNELDAQGMASCYDDAVIFKDPAFGTLQGLEAKAMWHMLCESQKGKDFKVSCKAVSVNKNFGEAQWEAFYVFSKTNRKVHNIINAKFEFKNGLIVAHEDDFNLYRWAKQALGFKGYLLGNTSFFRRQLQLQTRTMLEEYIKKSELIQD